MTNDMNEPLYIETPLVSSPILSKLAGWYSPRSTRTSYVDGSKILLKLENLQPSGSFKSRYHKGFREVLRFRGLGNLCKKMSERLGQGEEPHFFCSSEGNAGLAAASAARILGKKATICVTNNTPKPILERLKAEGAEVRQNGYYWSDADDLCRQLVKSEPNGVYCPPFDHQDVIEGNATIVYELKDQMQHPPDAIISCVGGGGLIGGIFEGLRTVPSSKLENPWRKVGVVGVETHGAASFNAAHTAGKHIGIDKIDTIAKSLGAKKISRLTFDLSQQHPGHVASMLVTDAQAANATWRFASSSFTMLADDSDDHRLMVEIACGATLSLVYEGLLKDAIPNLTKDSTVVLIICGGSSVTIESLTALK